MSKLLAKLPHWVDLLVILVILGFSPLFFYKLGQSSLVSWDEAWYAEIARNILKGGSLLNLTWSGQPFYDHPPTGFWLMALSFKILGVSEFSARFPSALSGLVTMVILYLLGKELFGRLVGFTSALALPSAYWFLYRARSGNLDIFLTMFFLLTIYLAVKSTTSRKLLIPFFLSLALLFLTKAVVPLVILPVLAVIFVRANRVKLWDLVIPAILFLAITGSWFIAQMLNHPNFINRFSLVGLPDVKIESSYMENLKLAKKYLHEGIGKWFWPGLASLFISSLLKQRRFYIFPAFFVVFFAPFIFSSRGGIWHLIPLHPVLILSFFATTNLLLKNLLKQQLIIVCLLMTVSLYFSSVQIKRSWYQFIDISSYTSDEEILSQQAKHFKEELFIEGTDFRPAAVFYSGKSVPQKIWEGDLKAMFETKEPFLLITNQNKPEVLGISSDKYQIIKKDRDKMLIIKR